MSNHFLVIANLTFFVTGQRYICRRYQQSLWKVEACDHRI